MKTKCDCGKMVADEQLQECSSCQSLICDMCGLGHKCTSNYPYISCAQCGAMIQAEKTHNGICAC